ncbi:MAG: hypothetical protein CMJ41_10675 [Phycisphaerae bacterium]|nr:hypothetical protein [Phycisphaerae bacterium]|tara:strand:- start:319 stop:1077 length:759 start_codon:yes stop_codon:yes gene_type:complete
MTQDDKKKQKEANFHCECGKSYIYRQGLHKHKKKCAYIPEESECNKIIAKPDSLEELSKTDLLNMVHEQNKIIRDIIPKIGNTTNNINNVRNNNFNIQVFLDENCKDAMTLQNFATEFQMTIEDILKYKQGKQSGVSNLLIQNLKPIPVVQRPIHCTDVKKRTWMIKDDDGWKRDNGKKVIKVTEYEVSKRFHDLWETAYPDWQKNERLTETYLEIVRSITCESSEKEIEKILKKIGPEYKLSAVDVKNAFV